MPKEIVVSTKLSDYDGLVNVVFRNEDGINVTKVDSIPISEEKKAIEDQLNEDEQKGTKFGLGIRRYILAKHGVKVSIEEAFRYYDSLAGLVKEAQDLFFPSPDASDSTDVNATDGQTTKSE